MLDVPNTSQSAVKQRTIRGMARLARPITCAYELGGFAYMQHIFGGSCRGKSDRRSLGGRAGIRSRRGCLACRGPAVRHAAFRVQPSVGLIYAISLAAPKIL